jgi:C-terminal processing protease CtpA/Prc
MRSVLMAAVLSVAAAGPAAAERSAAARVYVHGAGAGTHGVADSVEDVKKLLAAQKPSSLLALANSREEADLVLEVMERHTEDKMNYDLTPAIEWTYSIVTAALHDGDRSTPLKAETNALIKSWSTAADVLVTHVFRYVAENQHTLLRRRADWPAIGIEFEELTKERKKQYGIKDGKVVVTAVAPGGAGERAGLRAGDVIATVDGEKLKDPVKLARAIYARGPSATFALGVMQGGSTRAVSLAVP